MSGAVHVYISQSDKGELVIGAGIDVYNSLRAARQPARRSSTRSRRSSSCSRCSPRCACCASGAASSTSTPDAQPDHRQDAGRGPVRQLRLGHRRLQGDAGLGHVSSPHTIAQRRAARAQRAVRARALLQRAADRRSGAAGAAGALRRIAMLLIPCPWCGAREPRSSSPTAARRSIAAPARAASARRRGMGRLPLHPRQPEGPASRALAARPRLRPLVQCRARHDAVSDHLRRRARTGATADRRRDADGPRR